MGITSLLERVLHPERERRDMLGGLDAVYRRYGEAVSAKVFAFNMVYLFGPDANRKVLLDQDGIFSARKPWMAIMGRIFPNGLLLLDGEEHKRDRKIMKRAFTPPALSGYTERMNQRVEHEIAEWGKGPETFHAFPAIKVLTLKMAAEIFVGMDLGPGAPDTQPLNESLEDMVAASMSRVRLRVPGFEFYRGLQARDYMSKFIGERIAERRACDAGDIFSHFCQSVSDDGERFDDQQIIDHMSFLMMAAHDTTTSTLTSMLYELARHPEWQEKVRDEAIGLAAESLSYDECNQLPLLGRVMQETLRRYPPLPVIPRVALADFEFQGYRVPEGAMVVVSPLFTHSMPRWWDAPERFDPDRFSPERAEHERHSHSYIPFGGGAHMCIGLRFAETQVKIVLYHLLRQYRFSVPQGYEMPVQQAPISKPIDGLPLRLEPLP